VTLGSPSEKMHFETMEEEGTRRYFHHYNFPPFSVGETGRVGAPGRRDIGHGSLAEKAIAPVLPSEEEFPYTIRVVSEVLSSNGSSSMGSTCASSLALMDAGVPLKKPVAGIAIGIATDDKGNYKILTDLQDLEDGKGGMDFKVTGTEDGITAIQLDTKTDGLSQEILEKTLTQGKKARLEILEVMNKRIPATNVELSPYAPRIEAFMIDKDKIRDVIGPGGKVINEIIDTTGVKIDIDDDGKVSITSKDKESLKKGVEWVKSLVREAKVGEVYEGKVVRIMDFGAFVNILPKKDGLVHISELAPYHVNKVEDVVNIGDVITVKVMKIDDMGRINLTLKHDEGQPVGKKDEKDEKTI
ncbi:MAG: polyribonucleotide nucleotidyltransferase, partial [Parcubacteria group bacterium]|nr:polyribonucleotide nucleotidyltransferase [Parcubacteria group bacterium]